MPRPQINQIIQITDPAHHWYPALAVIDDVKEWGVRAYVWVVTNTSNQSGQAYIRLKNEVFEVVGQAAIVPARRV